MLHLELRLLLTCCEGLQLTTYELLWALVAVNAVLRYCSKEAHCQFSYLFVLISSAPDPVGTGERNEQYNNIFKKLDRTDIFIPSYGLVLLISQTSVPYSENHFAFIKLCTFCISYHPKRRELSLLGFRVIDEVSYVEIQNENNFPTGYSNVDSFHLDSHLFGLCFFQLIVSELAIQCSLVI